MGIVALVASAVAVTSQAFDLAFIRSSVQSASALVPEFGLYMGWRLVLLALGLTCWILPLVKRTNPPVIMMLIGFVLVLSGKLSAAVFSTDCT